MSSRRIKQQVMEILSEPRLVVVLEKLSRLPADEVVNALFSAICRSDELIRWHGISGMGPTVATIAEDEMEKARVVMRRILWSLNEESGGIGWGAPESFAEILVHHDGLADEYVHMLISYMRGDGEELFQEGNYLEHESLQRGLLWGMGRLAFRKPGMLRVRDVTGDIVSYLSSPDGSVRGLAARALGFLGDREGIEPLQGLKEDQEKVRVYDQGDFYDLTVSEMAHSAVLRLKGHIDS